jgi:hypothetical protein
VAEREKKNISLELNTAVGSCCLVGVGGLLLVSLEKKFNGVF